MKEFDSVYTNENGELFRVNINYILDQTMQIKFPQQKVLHISFTRYNLLYKVGEVPFTGTLYMRLLNNLWQPAYFFNSKFKIQNSLFSKWLAGLFNDNI